MMLDQITYKEAMDKARLSEETGMRLLEEAYGRKEKRRRSWSVRMAVFAGILISAVSANGICFAYTGQNVWDVFHAMYRNAASEDVAAMGEEFRECGESATHGNLKFTVERYWYDKENVEAYMTIRTDSLDGTPLDAESLEGYFALPETEGCAEVSLSDPVFSEDGKSAWVYHHISYAYDIAGNPYDVLNVTFSSPAEETSDDTGENEETNEDRNFGSVQLEPTGEMRAREIDASVLAGCSKARLTGAGLRLIFDQPKEECQEPVQMEVELADGTRYFLDLDKVFEELPGSEELPAEELPENICTVCGGSIDMRGFASGVKIYYMEFKDFINIDDVTGIYADGVELPLL